MRKTDQTPFADRLVRHPKFLPAVISTRRLRVWRVLGGSFGWGSSSKRCECLLQGGSSSVLHGSDGTVRAGCGSVPLGARVTPCLYSIS